HTPHLAHSLSNLAIALCELGRHDEELELRTEVVVRWRILAQLDPDEHKETYQRERARLAGSFSQHGHDPGAAWRAEEELARRLGLETE
ncbi:MAG TPA: hypothetical protein VFQ77_19930, partial [Pseudonocardiaceae bacterium]|nr:hypothetical protein [Pseudonocardiaceae bacterium]